MAKQYETNSLGFKLKFNGPESVEEYDRLAGKTGACLEDAVDNTIYRGTLPEFQDAFCKQVATLTGQTRQVNAEATAAAKSRSKTPEKVKDVMETVKTFVNRVTAGMSDEDKAALATTAQEVASGISIDPSPSKRSSGVSKDLRSKADSLLTLDEAALESKMSKWSEDYPTLAESVTNVERDEAGRPTIESLARLIGQVLDAKLAE